MKTFITLTLFLFCLSVKAQDTLYFPTGEIQQVELISVNKEAGLIKYKQGELTQIRSIASLKSYSNHANVGYENWKLVEGTVESDTVVARINDASYKDPSKYTYGKFSLGANLLSPLSLGVNDFDVTIATNYNQSLYVQYNLNNHIGFRLPMRIGFNQIKDTIILEQGEYLWKHDRDLLGEGGFEVLFMLDDNRKITPYLMPGIYIGVNQRSISNYNDSTYVTTYYPSPRHTYFRIGLTGGFQFNFSKHFQLNTEIGFNVNNSAIYYWSNYSNSMIYESFVSRRLGLQAAINLVYRFGGKLRE